MLYLRDPVRPHVWALGRPLVGVRQLRLHGVLPCLLQHFHVRTFSCRVSLHPSLAHGEEIYPVFFGVYRNTCRPRSSSAPVRSVHLHFAECAFKLLGKSLATSASSRRGGPRHVLVREDPRRVRSGDSLDVGICCTLLAMCGLFVRNIVLSLSILHATCVTAIQVYHTPEGELRCVATEIAQKPKSSYELFVVQHLTKHCFSVDALLARGSPYITQQRVSSCIPTRTNKLRALLADHVDPLDR